MRMASFLWGIPGNPTAFSGFCGKEGAPAPCDTLFHIKITYIRPLNFQKHAIMGLGEFLPDNRQSVTHRVS